MKIAIVGKGGVGKTTISGTLSRIFAQQGKKVLAIDADPNPNLSTVLGLNPDAPQPKPLSTDILERVDDGEGKTKIIVKLLLIHLHIKWVLLILAILVYCLILFTPRLV